MSTFPQRYTLEASQEKQLVSFLKKFAFPPDATFTAFEHDGIYSAHENNAALAARQIFHSSAPLRQIGQGDEKFTTIYLTPSKFESYARDLLLIHQYRLEVYKRAKSGTEWELAYKASPGHLLEVEELLFSKYDEDKVTGTGIIAVKPYQSLSGCRCMGIGYIDPMLKIVTISEFEDNEVFSNLQSAIIQLGARECLLPKLDQSAESTRLTEALKRNGIMATLRQKKDFIATDIVQDLGRLVKKSKKTGETLTAAITKNVSEKEAAASSLAACIRYLNLVNDPNNFDQYSFNVFDLTQFMKLDKTAYAALNLFSTDGGLVAGARKYADSLYSVLDNCKTVEGRRLLGQWIKQPLLDVNLIRERLNLVDVFVMDTTLRLSISGDHLKRFPDLSRLSKKFHKKAANLQDCYKVYTAVKWVPNLCECLAKNEEHHPHLVKEVFTTPLHESTMDFAKFADMIETTLDFEMISQHQFRVKSSFDPVLIELNENMEQIQDKMEKCFGKAAADLGLEKGKGLKFDSNAQFGHFFRVTCKDEKVLRSKKHYTTIDTKKDGVRFVTDKLAKLSQSYKECQNKYEEQQSTLVTEIILIASGYSDPMLRLGNLIAKLDVLVSFAQAAINAPIPYVKPVIHSPDEGKGIVLKDCRHPCLERQNEVSFIPNDVVFDRERNSFVIITGPNMGGKSTYIRQTGMVVLMAQIGSFVPCSEAEITVVDAILARVGAGDCQTRGISTFMSEMLDASLILRSATANSLVIIDELGRGTSTYDGFGLAWAISHHVATKIHAFSMFATHFHELTELADQVPAVTNLHVTALTGDSEDPDSTLTMLYQVKPGVCDQSFGIHVAENVGFPDHVIKRAKRKCEELENYSVQGDVGDDDDIETAKKKRRLKQEARDTVRNFMQKFKSVDWDSLTEDDATSKLKQLKDSIPTDNQFIRNIIDRS